MTHRTGIKSAVRSLSPAVALLAVCLTGSCLTKQGIIMPWTAERQLLERRLDSLQLRVAELDARLNEQSLAIRADIGNQLAIVNDRIGIIDSKLDDLSARLSRQPRAGRTDSAPARIDNAAQLYQQAYEDYTRGKYELAGQGFQTYLKTYPGTELADNAQYWLAECYYSQRQFSEAIGEFQKVVEHYPDSDKVPAALLKQGRCYEQLRDPAQAAKFYQLVIQQHPRTPEARLAEESLKKLQE